MPAEPMTLLLRPVCVSLSTKSSFVLVSLGSGGFEMLHCTDSLQRNFFLRNPALDVPPSYCSTPSQVAAGKGARDMADKMSKLVVVGGEADVMKGKAKGECCK